MAFQVPPRPPKSEKTCETIQAEQVAQPSDAKPRIPVFLLANAGSSIAVCGASYGDCGGLDVDVNDISTFETARRYCSSLGARLCTYQELLADETADTG